MTKWTFHLLPIVQIFKVFMKRNSVQHFFMAWQGQVKMTI